MDKEREIGALWEKKTQDNKLYYTGTINNQRVVMFKTHDTSNGKPTFRILKEKEALV